MDGMPEPRHAADSRLTTGQWALSATAAVLMLGLAALAFRGMFSAVRDEQVPFFGHIAWIVPIGIDLGIVILMLLGILLEWLAMPMPGLRIVAGFFMGCTMWLNATAAHGSAAGTIGHLSLPVLFIACVEAIRHAVRRRSGLAAGTVREGVPAARWALAPASTFALWRRMVLWQETSYARALELEQLRRGTIAFLRARHGDGWKSAADQSVVWQLAHGIDVEAAAALARQADTPVEVPAARQPARQRTASGGATDRDRARAKARRLLSAVPPPTFAEVRAKTGLSERTLSRIKSDMPRALHTVRDGVAG